MILFSNAKINIGLQVLRKRPDDYHDIQSLFLPLPFSDILELKPDNKGNDGFIYSSSGINIPGKKEENLCYKAWKKFNHTLGKNLGIRLHLHKQIPMGAGLGGGSSNAASLMRGLNQIAGSPFSESQLEKMAVEIGSDCAFFIRNKAAVAEGRGEQLTPYTLSIDRIFIVLLYPGIHISTAEAYSSLDPDPEQESLFELLRLPMNTWKDKIRNDFETTVFPRYKELEEIKTSLYAKGAIYASMSGSGSAIYGIFNKPAILPDHLNSMICWQGWI